MDLPDIIESLADPAAYPVPASSVEVRQTHISVVFLVDQFVFKIKKPIKLPFLDFSTLELRRHFCEEEVRLNARLAGDVYLGVVPVVLSSGRLTIGGQGELVEWAVQMRRLPEDATLERRLVRHVVTIDDVALLAQTIADFHASAERNDRIASFGNIEHVATNARANFREAQNQIGQTISQSVFDRLILRTEEAIESSAAIIQARSEHNVPCDTHGDLRIDHVYFLRGTNDSQQTVIIDCIEFNEAFRYADPVADVAFLAMDMRYAGAHGLADVLTDSYFDATGDNQGRSLLNFYVAYRAAVRGKVEGLKQAETEVASSDRNWARVRARGYWLLALSQLELPEDRPCLVLMSGLPGSGKSTLAAELARAGSFEIIRSDLVRKELAGQIPAGQASQTFGTGTYTTEWDDRTYGECLRRAEAMLFDGRRVIVDASFRKDARRREFMVAADRWKVPAILLHCQATSQVVRHRLRKRQDDPSDADWQIHQAAAKAWETSSELVAANSITIDTGNTLAESLDSSLSYLRKRQLVR